MRLFIILSALVTLLLSHSDCHKKDTVKYKARLEIKGICMNYTIQLLDGNLDTSMIAANWTDEMTDKYYQNVFALGNPCNFPASIDQGEEFYFIIDKDPPRECMVCEAYYPVPPKKLVIKVVDR